jgi:hypothetical protein
MLGPDGGCVGGWERGLCYVQHLYYNAGLLNASIFCPL